MWEKVRAKDSKGRNHPFEAQKVEIILSKVPLHHNTSAISLKYPSFIFQFDPTRINQSVTTRHIFDLDYFPSFRLSPILWTCWKETKYIKERHPLVMTYPFNFFSPERTWMSTVDSWRVRSSLACRASWLTINRAFFWIHVPCILIECPPIDGWTIPEEDWPFDGPLLEPWTDDSNRGLNKGTQPNLNI